MNQNFTEKNQHPFLRENEKILEEMWEKGGEKKIKKNKIKLKL